jgi:hypothetical protein
MLKNFTQFTGMVSVLWMHFWHFGLRQSSVDQELGILIHASKQPKDFIPECLGFGIEPENTFRPKSAPALRLRSLRYIPRCELSPHFYRKYRHVIVSPDNNNNSLLLFNGRRTVVATRMLLFTCQLRNMRCSCDEMNPSSSKKHLY